MNFWFLLFEFKDEFLEASSGVPGYSSPGVLLNLCITILFLTILKNICFYGQCFHSYSVKIDGSEEICL